MDTYNMQQVRKVPWQWRCGHPSLNPSDIQQCEVWPCQSPPTSPLPTSFRPPAGERQRDTYDVLQAMKVHWQQHCGHTSVNPSDIQQCEVWPCQSPPDIRLPTSFRTSAWERQRDTYNELQAMKVPWQRCGGHPSLNPSDIQQCEVGPCQSPPASPLRTLFRPPAGHRQRDTYNMLQVRKVPRQRHCGHLSLNPSDIRQCEVWPCQFPFQIPLPT